MKKPLTLLALMVLVASLGALAQEQDIRDVARQVDADTTSSTSTGTDKNRLHADTERVGEIRQHAPALLDSGQKPTVRKMSKEERNRLLERRKQLLKDREAAGEAAAEKAKAASEAPRATSLPQSRQVTAAEARKDAKRDWDARRGKELEKIGRALREESVDSGEVRFHAPSLINPK